MADNRSRVGGSPLSSRAHEAWMLRCMDEYRLRNGIIIGVTFVVAVAMVGLFWILRKSNEHTIHASKQFAVAVVRNDPAAAPHGGADYVKGVRAYFGPVTSARVIDSHNHGVNTGDSADTRSYYVGDILLATKRGPAVIELAFDNQSLSNSSEKISSIHELAPDKVRKHKLSAGDREALEAAFKERGGKPGELLGPSGPVKVVKPFKIRVDKHLACIQAAHGDVSKMQRCG
jgi:hypothetical protein